MTTPHFDFAYSRSVPATVNEQAHLVKLLHKQYIKTPNYQPSPTLLAQLDEGYAIGDPLCDAWLEDAQQLPKHGMPMFNQALHQGIYRVKDAPQSLKNLFAQIDEKPVWVDDGLLLLATKTLMRYPILQGLILQSVALMGGYSVPGLAAPLIATGALTKNTLPRVARTLAFIAAVTLPYGLKYANVGYQQAVHVRLVHGLVRLRLKNDATWDTARFGVPINQTDVIATNMTFSLLVVHGLMNFGCLLSEREQNSILHLWRYIGYLLGIQQHLMPVGINECNQWFHAYLATQQLDSKRAKPLAQALHELPLQLETHVRAKAVFEQQLRAIVTRHYWGDDIGNDLGLPKPKWLQHSIKTMRTSQVLTEKLQQIIYPVAKVKSFTAAEYRNYVKRQYITAKPDLKPLFDSIEAAYLDAVA